MLGEKRSTRGYKVFNDDGIMRVKRFDDISKMWVTLQFIDDKADDREIIDRAKEVTVQTLIKTG